MLSNSNNDNNDNSDNNDQKLTTISSQSGSKWDKDDLDYFKIVIKSRNQATFFGEHFMDVDTIELDNAFYEYETYQEMQQSDYRTFPIYRLNYLIDRIMNIETLESACDDFAICLLLALNFEKRNLHLHSRFNLSLRMKYKDTDAETNLCLLREDDSIIMLQENKPLYKTSTPEGQIIAEGIAAYQYNNRLRREKNKLELNEYTFPFMTMVGSRFTFYNIKVTSKLNEAVERGLRPDEETVVDKFDPFDSEEGIKYGMLHNDIKRATINFLNMFKQLLKEA
ncbi:unnamed protein product [Cunninghamella echinulata]